MGSVADTVERALQGCLEDMPEADCIPKEQLSISIHWITKWFNYSKNYSLGYQLSDNAIGVLLKNSAHMGLLPDKKNCSLLCRAWPLLSFPNNRCP